jgi:hypothetical protein
MTISEALTRVDAVKPNTYSDEDKIRWLSTLDGFVKEHIIDTHEGGERVVFRGYDETTSLETELLVPAPHDHIYIHWLEAQIDYANDEYDRYENTMDMYNTAYDNFKNYYNRTHMPKGKKFKYF